MRLELTHRGSYAVRAVVALARDADDGFVPSRRIAQEMGIPVRFLPQILGDLHRAGIVEARLGRAGGYRLSRRTEDISLLDVLGASEGDARRQACVLTGEPCGSAAQPCDVHDMFFDAEEAVLARLSATTIADVVTPAATVAGQG